MYIKYFARQIKSADNFRFHGGRINFFCRNTAGCYNGLFNRSCLCNSERQFFYCLPQMNTLCFFQRRRRNFCGDICQLHHRINQTAGKQLRQGIAHLFQTELLQITENPLIQNFFRQSGFQINITCHLIPLRQPKRNHVALCQNDGAGDPEMGKNHFSESL